MVDRHSATISRGDAATQVSVRPGRIHVVAHGAQLSRIQIFVATDVIDLIVDVVAAATCTGFIWDHVDPRDELSGRMAIGTVNGTRIHIVESDKYSSRALLEVSVMEFESTVDRVRRLGVKFEKDQQNFAAVRIADLTIVLLGQRQ